MAARGKSPSKATSVSRGSATRARGQRRKVAGDAHRTSVKEREESAPSTGDAVDAAEAASGSESEAEPESAADGGRNGHDAGGGVDPEHENDPQNGNDLARGDEPRRKRWRPSRTALVRSLIGLLVVALLAAGGFGVATYLLYNGASASNRAVVDEAATRKVSDDVSRALQKSFSYDHARPEAAEQEAHEVLTGKAIEQYTQLFGQVKQIAPQQQLVLSSAARSIGVTELEDGHARLLAFVDQQGLRGDNNQRRSGTAQLDVSARLVGDTWKVDDIKVL